MSHRRWMITLIFLLMASIGLFIAVASADFSLIQDKAIVLERADFSPDLDAENFLIPGDLKHTYKIQISKALFDGIGQGNYKVLIYRLADNAHEVYLNDVLIGSAGNKETLRSNLWNGLYDYTISRDLLKYANELKIVTYSSYRTGLSTNEIYIVDQSLASVVTGKLNFFGENLILFSVGFIMFSSILSLLLYVMDKKNGKVYLYLAIATFLTGVYFVDYLAFENTVISYLHYKKITMGGLFFAIGFYSYAISAYFDSFLAKYAGHCLNLGTAIILIISTNMIMFKHIYGYWYYVNILCIVIWIGLSLIHVSKSNIAYIFLLSFTTVAVYGTIAASMDFAGNFFEINSPVVYIMVFAMVPVLLVYEGFNEQERLLTNEKVLRQKEFFKSITDELTGVWNQRYLAMLLNEDLRHYTMAILDIDNFKAINDTYGHVAGDIVLKSVAKIIKQSVRKSDKVCRYGGDEFVIVLDHCPITEAFDVMEKIRKAIENMTYTQDGRSFNVSVSIGMDFDNGTKNMKDFFKEVDDKLYTAKKLGKNRIAYSELIDNNDL